MFSPTAEMLNVVNVLSGNVDGCEALDEGAYLRFVSPTLTEFSTTVKYWLTCLMCSAGLNSLSCSFCISYRKKSTKVSCLLVDVLVREPEPLE